VQYAKDRVQSRPVDGSINASAAIIHHPDVKRMLMTHARHRRGLPRHGHGGGCRV